MPAARKFFALWAVGVFLLTLVALERRPSSDLGWYVEWEKVLVSGDFLQLESPVLSPRLLPLSEHFPGAGAVFAIPKLFLHTAVTFEGSAYVAGLLSTLAFWICALALFLDFSASSIPLTLFGLAALLLGTHAGQQASAIASENVSVTMLAILIASLALRAPRDEQRPSLFRTLAFSCSGALLATIRPNLAVYVAAGGLVVLVRILASEDSARRKALLLAESAAPLVFGVAWLAVHNIWMTGNWTHSPYMFGDSRFHSLDLRHPLFAAVLFHPYHGLLLFHPLYGVGLAVLLFSWIRGRFSGRDDRIFYGVATAGLVATMWLQASWYGWWMGTDTFGGRAFSTYSILLMPLVVAMLSPPSSSRTRTFVLSIVVSCACWTFPLLSNPNVSTLTYGDFFATYARLASNTFRHPEDILLVPAIWAAARWYFGRRETRGDRNLLAVVCALWALVVIELASGIERPDLEVSYPAAATFAMRFVKVAVIALLPVALAQALAHARGFAYAVKRAQTLVFAAVVIAFAGTALLVCRLYVRTGTEGHDAAVRSCYAYQADFFYPAPANTSGEYTVIPGFDKEKENLARFVREAGPRVRLATPALPRSRCLAATGYAGSREFWIGSLIWRTILRH